MSTSTTTTVAHPDGTTVSVVTVSEDWTTDEGVETYGDDELYFGSLKVHLAQVPGTAMRYEHADWSTLGSKESIAEVLSRTERQGKNADIIVPAIPALDIGIAPGDAAAQTRSADVSTWPAFMQSPLLKVGMNIPAGLIKKHPDGPSKAFASGVRSCTMKIGEKWYRLKGSGNNDEGVVVRSDFNAVKGDFTRQLRGVAWINTCSREVPTLDPGGETCVCTAAIPTGSSTLTPPGSGFAELHGGAPRQHDGAAGHARSQRRTAHDSPLLTRICPTATVSAGLIGTHRESWGFRAQWACISMARRMRRSRPSAPRCRYLHICISAPYVIGQLQSLRAETTRIRRPIFPTPLSQPASSRPLTATGGSARMSWLGSSCCCRSSSTRRG